ncbi:atherin-like [Bacillus rossius redtenbacheri]|uniref:atherin-like n=1 Tax=Bacillus rossius redtenbacheri TaxID=93214 RepID=UPI002FDE6856
MTVPRKERAGAGGGEAVLIPNEQRLLDEQRTGGGRRRLAGVEALLAARARAQRPARRGRPLPAPPRAWPRLAAPSRAAPRLRSRGRPASFLGREVAGSYGGSAEGGARTPPLPSRAATPPPRGARRGKLSLQSEGGSYAGSTQQQRAQAVVAARTWARCGRRLARPAAEPASRHLEQHTPPPPPCPPRRHPPIMPHAPSTPQSSWVRASATPLLQPDAASVRK